MRIESVDLAQVELELKEPFITRAGSTLQRSSIIVAVHDDDQTGLGECVAFEEPWYSPETTATAWQIMSDVLIPRLLATSIAEPDDVWTAFAPIRGHNMAKAALEMACWDLMARRAGVPLADLLGGSRERVPVGVSIGIQPSPDALVHTTERYLADGYTRIKLKIEPGSDLAFLEAVRAAFPKVLLQVDANSAYSLADIAALHEMDRFNLLLIEQPLAADDLTDHALLQRDLITPICLDESIQSPETATQALELGSCRIVNIKPGRLGGHTQSRAIHDLCLSRGAPVWCGGMLETNIGRAHNVALASLPGFSLPGDISASERYFQRDIAGPPFILDDDSTLTVPKGPGIGVELDSDIRWERRRTFRQQYRVAPALSEAADS